MKRGSGWGDEPGDEVMAEIPIFLDGTTLRPSPHPPLRVGLPVVTRRHAFGIGEANADVGRALIYRESSGGVVNVHGYA